MKAIKFFNVFKWICASLLAIVLITSCFGCQTTPETSEPPHQNGDTENDDKIDDGTKTDDSEYDDDESQDPPAWALNYSLPDGNEALEKLNELYGGAEKVFLLQSGKIARMPCPKSETVTLNMTYEVNDYTKLVLEDSVAEFNEVFQVINPNYKFAINYSPTDEDLTAKYSVKMSASDNLAVTETSQVFGLAHVSYYNNFTELGDFGITIKSEVLNNGSYLMTTFKHELMHLLGAGDAYQNANATKATVMQSYTVNGYHYLSTTDVAFLDILYRNPEFNDDENILDYIETYEETTEHTRTVLTAKVYQKLIDEIDPEYVTNQAVEKGYKDLTEFAEFVKDGITRDTSFGSSNISFTEIEYTVKPDSTFYGRIDLSSNYYWHGVQTTIGNAQGAKLTDYGTGILYAAPNGNLYTILIKTGSFILAFRLNGSFTNFIALSLDLWYIAK